MKKSLILTCLLGASIVTSAQQKIELELWPGGAPENSGLTETVRPDGAGFNNVTDARLFVYLPAAKKANGQAIVICPGGGYSGLAMQHEGYQVAAWLNERGIAAIILKYRMPAGHYTIPAKDVFRAIEITRERAAEWHIATNKVGVMGFSAGGHLASTAATHFTSPKNRPDFAALIYPVITMDQQFTHGGSRRNLIGDTPSEGLIAAYSNELRVSANTPPTFIAYSDDDTAVPAENGIRFYQAMKTHKLPCEFHIYPTGGHGWGWRDTFKYKDEFRASFERWLKEIDKKTVSPQ
ncbi:acetyl esterase/lipase [Parabacteroides sp. PFB2-10]|uniref:alpha/beta hydrolase n=1 Tax=Parabacteroides sp. PFB2-10 TaxID=1742405 RepID=UPI002473F3BE|nr:alpha/beta hydrolase [Parabacteroides sp. PFB2-10]MDH6311961.1 acetyl esterase/lipase [Parabacteroides sp. PFB2-10]